MRYRCEHNTPLGLSWDPACEERGRSCPALLEMVRHLVITPMLCPALLEMVRHLVITPMLCPALLEMVRHLVITPMLCPALLEMVEAHV